MKKIFNILGFIIGTVGLIVGVLSYSNSLKSKKLSFNTYSPSFKIYDSELMRNSADLNISLQDSSIIDKNIYLTTFAIWNSGDLPIELSDIRKDVKIKFKGIEKILDFKIIKEENLEVSKFNFQIENDSLFKLDWKYFDPTHGIKVQLIYFGNQNIYCEVDAIILDTKFIEFIPFQNRRTDYSRNFVYFVIFFTVFLFVYSSYRLTKQKFNRKSGADIIFTFVLPLIYVLFSLFMIYSEFLRVEDIPF